MRPVINLSTNQLELIGTMEQLYLDIAVTAQEIHKGACITLQLVIQEVELLKLLVYGLADYRPILEYNLFVCIYIDNPTYMYSCSEI